LVPRAETEVVIKGATRKKLITRISAAKHWARRLGKGIIVEIFQKGYKSEKSAQRVMVGMNKPNS
jgi:hypothetical protein